MRISTLLLASAHLLLSAFATPSTSQDLSLPEKSPQAFARYDRGFPGTFKNTNGDQLSLKKHDDGSLSGTLNHKGELAAVIGDVEKDVLTGLAGESRSFKAEFENGALGVHLGESHLLLHRVCEVNPAISDLGPQELDPKRRWTIAIYMAGDNDLEPYALNDVVEMIGALPIPGVEVLIFLDRAPGYLDEEDHWTDANIYRFDATSKSFGVAKSVGEVNTADASTFASFLVGAFHTYPAQHHAALVWNHGGGWSGIGVDESSSAAGSASDLLDLQEIRSALLTCQIGGTGRPLDLILFDACLMAQLEVALQVSDCADILIGSEDIVPGQGFPYKETLQLFADPDLTPRDLAAAFPDLYTEYYGANQRPSHTLASIDLRAVSQVASALDQFAHSCQEKLDENWPSIVRSLFFGESYEARSNRLSASSPPSFDILDLTHRIALHLDDASVSDAYRLLEAAINKAVIASRTGDLRRLSHGLAVYAPRNESQWTDAYKTTPLGSGNRWTSMLRAAIALPATIAQEPIEFANVVLDTHDPKRKVVYPFEGDTLSFSLTGNSIVQLTQMDAVRNEEDNGWMVLRKRWVPDPNWMVRAKAGSADLADLYMPVFQDGRTDITIELTGLQFLISDGTENASRATLDSTGLATDAPIVASAIWYPGNGVQGTPVECHFDPAWWNVTEILDTSVQNGIAARQVEPQEGDAFAFLIETAGDDGSPGTLEGPRLSWQGGLELILTADEPDAYATFIVAQTLDGRGSNKLVTYTVEKNPGLEEWAASWDQFDPTKLTGTWHRSLLAGPDQWRDLDSPSLLEGPLPNSPNVLATKGVYGPKDDRKTIKQFWVFEPRGLPSLRLITPVDGGSDIFYFGPARFGVENKRPFVAVKALQVGGVIWRWQQSMVDWLKEK